MRWKDSQVKQILPNQFLFDRHPVSLTPLVDDGRTLRIGLVEYKYGKYEREQGNAS